MTIKDRGTTCTHGTHVRIRYLKSRVKNNNDIMRYEREQ